jgi:hypothetical protein
MEPAVPIKGDRVELMATITQQEAPNPLHQEPMPPLTPVSSPRSPQMYLLSQPMSIKHTGAEEVVEEQIMVENVVVKE